MADAHQKNHDYHIIDPSPWPILASLGAFIMNIAAKPPLTIRLCGPRGFCAGVDRAIQIVVLALKSYGAPVYVRHEIVHNRYVVEGLEAKGAVFVEELDEIPAEHRAQPVVFSAHGDKG